jgi:hypothetical protein
MDHKVELHLREVLFRHLDKKKKKLLTIIKKVFATLKMSLVLPKIHHLKEILLLLYLLKIHQERNRH